MLSFYIIMQLPLYVKGNGLGIILSPFCIPDHACSNCLTVLS